MHYAFAFMPNVFYFIRKKLKLREIDEQRSEELEIRKW